MPSPVAAVARRGPLPGWPCRGTRFPSSRGRAKVRRMDFGASAVDYATHRKGFPPSFFERVPLRGRILDLGTGTGSVASGYARRGAWTVGLDLSLPMLRAAEGVPARLAARAEALPFRAGAFDAVVAGQCWHWFDGPAAARECWRVLRPGGALVI